MAVSSGPKFVRVRCPMCRSGGQAPVEKLDRRCTCRQCSGRFFIAKTGESFVYLGEPAPTAARQGANSGASYDVLNAGSSKTFDEAGSLRVECPSCGYNAPVPLAHLDHGMICLKCSGRFHIDQGGIRVVDQPSRDRSFGQSSILLAGNNSVAATLAPMAARVSVMPGWAKWAAVVPALLVLYWIFGSLGSDSVEDITPQAVLLGEALARNNPQAIQDLTAPPDQPTVARWLERTRPAGWPAAVGAGTPVNVTAKMVCQDQDTGECCVYLTIAPPAGAAARSGGDSRTMWLFSFWKNVEGEWVFDPETTVQGGKRADSGD